MRPICVPCKRFFRIKKSGFAFTEGMPMSDQSGRVARPGTLEADRWRPYKVWMADLCECPGCGARILSGFGMEPVSEKHHDGFDVMRAKLGADQFQVNDC
jgi:hypothetical protein